MIFFYFEPCHTHPKEGHWNSDKGKHKAKMEFLEGWGRGYKPKTFHGDIDILCNNTMKKKKCVCYYLYSWDTWGVVLLPQVQDNYTEKAFPHG